MDVSNFPIYQKELLIREGHLDTFGHINNAAYLEIFEEARWDWIDGNGFGIETISQIKMGPSILHIDIQFSREVKNRESVSISTELSEYKGKIAKVTQEMKKSDTGEVACRAVFTIGLFDLQARKLIEPTEQWLKALGKP